jgi:hypothetical protein
MLNLNKLMLQIRRVTADHLRTADGDDKTLEELRLTFQAAALNHEATLCRLKDNETLAYWPVAVPLEPVGTVVEIGKPPECYTVVAADGSQIMPSHHEVYNCYLLNIGTTMLTYGTKSAPLLDSEPHLFHRSEDLYPLVDRRRIHIDELYVSLERNLLELTSVRQTAWKAKERQLPIVAFLDGSLITWSLDKMPPNYQLAYHDTLSEILQYFREERIPFIGYISHSRSSDIVNSLRICRCPYEFSRCKDNCGHLAEEDFPCSSIWPACDRQLMYDHLPPNSRSAIFASGAQMARQLQPGLQTAFCYINVGKEIARIEFPRWMAEDEKLMDFACQVCIAQAVKGSGYPVCLAESHNLAVIRSSDRVEFFRLMERQLIDLGIEKVSTSPKETRKRQGII